MACLVKAVQVELTIAAGGLRPVPYGERFIVVGFDALFAARRGRYSGRGDDSKADEEAAPPDAGIAENNNGSSCFAPNVDAGGGGGIQAGDADGDEISGKSRGGFFSYTDLYQNKPYWPARTHGTVF